MAPNPYPWLRSSLTGYETWVMEQNSFDLAVLLAVS